MKPTVKTVEFFPLMGIHSQDTKHGGAWRLSVLFSSLDHGAGCDHKFGICKGGSGKILRARLQAEAEALGVKRSTFFSWLADARSWGILRGEGEYLYIASQAKLAQIFLCNTIDEHKAIIPAKLLFKPGWKAIIQAAYLKANHSTLIGLNNKLEKQYRGDIVSRRTIESITGIAPRTQRRNNRFVTSKKNIAITTIPGSRETAATLNNAARDQGQNRHYFPFNDPQQKDPAGIKNYRRVLAHTLPSRHSVSDKYALIGARGNRRRIMNAIQKGLRLANFGIIQSSFARPQQANGQPSNSETFVKFARTYQDQDPKPTRRRNVDRENVPEILPRERFILHKQARKVGVYRAVTTA